MLPTYAFGFDFGNAETGATLFHPEDGHLRSLTLPSATAPGRLADLLRTRAGLGLNHLSAPPHGCGRQARPEQSRICAGL